MNMVFISMALVSVLLASWAASTGFRRKSLLMFIPVITLITLTMLNTLGSPKPVQVVYGADTVEVLAFHLKEGESIYLWLLPPGASEPQYIELPWRLATAKQLQAAQEAAEKEGTWVNFVVPSIWGEEALEFYAAPQPPNPPKP